MFSQHFLTSTFPLLLSSEQMLLRSPLRWHTFRVMILTSLVWVIFGMCILVYYMECLNGNGVNCRSKSILPAVPPDQQQQAAALQNGGGHNGAAALKSAGAEEEEDWPHLRLPPYTEAHLHTWVAPSKCRHHLPNVWPVANTTTDKWQTNRLMSSSLFLPQLTVMRSNPSSWPGENGKGVDLPKDQEKLKEEKFKLNQFNLIASDMIALNRSINDVRLDG